MAIEKSTGLIGTIVDKSKATKCLNQVVPAYSKDSYMMRFRYGYLNKNRTKNKRYRKKFKSRIRDFFKKWFNF
ncbi:MAG: hypothetical protein WC264_02165 [Candidatus Paceibacterota bacterium]|jgi:hypothetical protein